MLTRKHSSYQKAQGAVLIVSLVLLTVMTIIGVAAMDTQTLQSQMARNSIYSQSLYQKALSELDAQIELFSDCILLTPIITSSFSIDGNAAIEYVDSEVLTHDANDPYTQYVSITYLGETEISGGDDTEINSLKHFEFNSIASIAGTGSQSSQVQGATCESPRTT